MKDIRESWKEILEALKNEYEISDLAFSSWIKPLSIYKIEDGVVTIVVPGEQIGVDYVKRKYYLPLKVAAADITGKEYELVFISEEDTHKKESSKKDLKRPFHYTFDNFVVGSNNNFAYSASLAVAESPGVLYNPLFLYGGVGLGKTHLMHAITHYISENHPDMNILYVTSEQFTNEIVEALHLGNGNTNANISRFREKYRHIDVLLIDDIQFIIGKDATQEEFFHTFNTLYEEGKQIVISSDRPPKDMILLNERYKSRFGMGLMADIQSPDYETRVAILRKKQELEGFFVPDEVTEYIASNVKSNIRELEGSLNKIIAVANLEKCEITLDLAKRHLADFITPDEKKKITPSDIIAETARFFQISPEDIKGTNRSNKIAYPRQIAMYLIQKLNGSTLKEIGEIMGKDHSTVIYGIKKIEDSIDSDEKTNEIIESLTKNLRL